MPFNVNTATILTVTPASGVPGTPVTIAGSSFGAAQGGGQVWLGTANSVVQSWSDTQIVALVASGSASGNALVLQNGVMSTPERGEIWLADLGIAAKVRPVLVVSIPFADRDYALVQVIPHTTQPRGAQFEIPLPVRFLETGAFNVQGMMAVPAGRFLRRLGDLPPAQMRDVEATMRQWLGLAG